MRCRFCLRADSVTAGKTSGLQSSENRGNQVKLPSAKLHFLAPTHSADCIRPTLTSCESVVVRANEEESWAGDGSILGSCIIFISIQIIYINSRWVFLSCLVWDCLMTCSTLLLSKLIVLHHHRTKLRLIGFIICTVPIPLYSMTSASQWRRSIVSFLRKIDFDTADPAKGTPAKYRFLSSWSGWKSSRAVSWTSWGGARQEMAGSGKTRNLQHSLISTAPQKTNRSRLKNDSWMIAFLLGSRNFLGPS